METIDVIKMRLCWNPKQSINGYSFLYEMVVLTDEMNNIVGVRDHTVIIKNNYEINSDEFAVVHLSHILITEKSRAKCNGFLSDEYPEATAREMIQLIGLDKDTPIILVAEVEPLQPGNKERERRLRIFRALHYKPVDPNTIYYVQPDFRSPEEIDSAGDSPQPLPLILLIKQIQQRENNEIATDVVKHIVNCLYKMYEKGMKAEHVKCVYDTLATYPTDNTAVSLLWENVGLRK